MVSYHSLDNDRVASLGFVEEMLGWIFLAKYSRRFIVASSGVSGVLKFWSTTIYIKINFKFNMKTLGLPG